jgi:ATP-dependent protease Clp ATPase subunit
MVMEELMLDIQYSLPEQQAGFECVITRDHVAALEEGLMDRAG